MTYSEIKEKLRAAQVLLADIYDIPELKPHENDGLSCADSCIIEILDSLKKRGL